MKVLLNEAGYVESYALEGELLEAVECDPPTKKISLCLKRTLLPFASVTVLS